MPRKLIRRCRRVLKAAILIFIVFALGLLPGEQRLGAAATQLAWNEDPASIVTGFAITLDGVRIDYGLTPEPSSGPCGCSIPLPFTSGEHTVVLSAYNTGGETFGPPVVLGPTASAGGPYAAQPATTLAVSASGSTDNLGTITSYMWQWGDGTANTSSASPTASHVYAAAGTYTVTLTVTDDFPASNSTTTTATITGGAPQPPSAPASPNPANGATGVSATPTLTWTATNATTYDVQFGTTSPPPQVVTGEAVAAYTPPTLTAGTTYFWQIVAHGSGGTTTGPVWSFATSATTTVTYVSDTFTDANGTALGSHTPDIGARWVDEEAGANIQSNKLESTSFIEGRAYNPTLPPSADYQVSVDVTMAIAGWGNQGGVRGRDTSGVFGGPAYEAYFNDNNKTWYLTYWGAGNPTTIGTSPDPGFTSGTKTITLQMSGSTISVSVAGATIISVTDTHVPANGYPGIVNNGGLNTAMLLDNFLVTAVGGTPQPPPGTPAPPPGTPASPNPSNGATSVSTTPTLIWTATNATTYDVQFGTTNPPPQAVTGEAVAAYTPPTLTAGTTYFWQIVAHGSGGTTTGPVWSFTTTVGLPLPSTPASPNPSNGATSVSTTPTLTWSATNATSYDVEVGTTNPPSFMITGQSAASYTPAALTAGTTYFWQIIAHGSGGTTTGPVWSFATSATTTVTYVSDTFTDANGTALGSHTPEVGAQWVDEEAGANIQSNKLESTNFTAGRAYNPTLPATADYQVSVDVTMAITGWGNQGGVRGRDTSASVGSAFGGPAYEAYFNENDQTWYLAYWIGGNPTTIGTSPDPGFTSGTKTLTLQMSGSTISVGVAGSTIISVTDTHVPANGYPGIVNNGGLNTAMLLDNYLVTAIPK